MMGARQTIPLESLIKKSLEYRAGTYWLSTKKKQPKLGQDYKVQSPSLYNIHQVPATRSWNYVVCDFNRNYVKILHCKLFLA